MKMCSAFAKHGNQVLLLAPNVIQKNTELEIVDAFQYYQVDSNFHIDYGLWPKMKGRWVVYLGSIWRAIGRYNPDLVYTRYIWGALISVILHKKTIFESHAPFWVNSKIEELVFSFLLKNKYLKNVVVISEALKKDLEFKFHTHNKKIFVSPDGADSQNNIATIKIKHNKSTPLRVGYVGNLYPGKGMEVIQKITHKLQGFDFHIIGGTKSDVDFWKNRINTNNVIFHGYVEPFKVRGYLEEIDICLLPNQKKVKPFTNREKYVDIGSYTSPLKMFEYMSMGKAIVASNLDILREILDESTALFANPDDPNEWITRIQILTDPKLRLMLGENAKALFELKFTWESRATNILHNL